MAEESGKRDYTTVELRKNLGEALGRAHFQREVVRVMHHGRPYAGLVSDDDAGFIEAMREHGSDFTELKRVILGLIDDGKDLGEIVDDLNTAQDKVDLIEPPLKSGPKNVHSFNT